MKKINILIISIDTDGVGYYRLLNPHSSITDERFNITIRISTDPTLNLSDEEYISQYDIIVYNKNLIFHNQDYYKMFMYIVHKHNIKMVYDIDDYWILDNTHINYNQWEKSNAKESTENLLKHSDFVTTTTGLFADKIKEINNNVHIFENAINKNEQQWRFENKIKSDKIRFLWGGGISHLPDLNILKKSINLLDDDFRKKTQLYLCGFDLRVKTPKGIIKGNPLNSPWDKFENIFTNNKRWVDNTEYKKFLNEYSNLNFGINEKFRYSEFYQRRWTKPILTYGTMYQESDIVLAPLKNMPFNYYKSQLKVIESGIYKCPIIASNFGPYKIDIENGVDGFLIDENKPLEWYEKMKWFVDNPNAIEDMGEKLYEKIVSKYEMNVVTNKRLEFYSKIIN